MFEVFEDKSSSVLHVYQDLEFANEPVKAYSNDFVFLRLCRTHLTMNLSLTRQESAINTQKSWLSLMQDLCLLLEETC